MAQASINFLLSLFALRATICVEVHLEKLYSHFCHLSFHRGLVLRRSERSHGPADRHSSIHRTRSAGRPVLHSFAQTAGLPGIATRRAA